MKTRYPEIVAVYAVIMLVYVGVVDSANIVLISVLLLAFLCLVHALVGFLIGKWWVILLPAATVLLAMPFGDSDHHEPNTWVLVAFQATFYVPALIAGALLGSFVARARRSASAARAA